jgi:hypothetical protein
MPRLVPSEIVKYIDDSFKFATDATQPKVDLGIDHIGRLSAIIAMVDHLPNELFVLPPGEYAELISQVEQIRGALRATVAHGSAYKFEGKHVWRIRRLLAKCPDSAPSDKVAGELRFVKDKVLRNVLRTDITEAYHCLTEGRWKAATVLAGSVIEALLVWRLSRYTAAQLMSAATAVVWPPSQKAPKGPPDGWKFFQLIKVAAKIGAISSDAEKQADLARDYRNLIHSHKGVRAKEQCGKDTALGALSGVERVIREFSK